MSTIFWEYRLLIYLGNYSWYMSQPGDINFIKVKLTQIYMATIKIRAISIRSVGVMKVPHVKILLGTKVTTLQRFDLVHMLLFKSMGYPWKFMKYFMKVNYFQKKPSWGSTVIIFACFYKHWRSMYSGLTCYLALFFQNLLKATICFFPSPGLRKSAWLGGHFDILSENIHFLW